MCGLSAEASLWVIATDIFGVTPAVEEMALAFRQAGGQCLVVDPYDGESLQFGHESEAYQTYLARCGHDAYFQRLMQRLTKVSGKQIHLLSFSAGASAAWRLAATQMGQNIQQLLGFYPSQIRHHLALQARCEVTLLFPKEEPHFEVDEVMAALLAQPAVHCSQTQGKHGFMNPRSDHYDESMRQAFSVCWREVTLWASANALRQGLSASGKLTEWR